jgi:hypothetical protein
MYIRQPRAPWFDGAHHDTPFLFYLQNLSNMLYRTTKWDSTVVIEELIRRMNR